MPELPEVEVVCRKLAPQVTGRRIVRARLLRKPDPNLERALAGRTIFGVRRRAKYIVLDLDGEGALLFHLKMTGNLYATSRLDDAPRTTRAWFQLDDGQWVLLDDPRALASVKLGHQREIAQELHDLGVEPLCPEFTPALLAQLAARARLPIKPFLMDQRRIAGLGNIYSAEALFEAGIHPARPACQIRRQRIERLHQAIVTVLARAVESISNATGPGHGCRFHSPPVHVYGREGKPCVRCGARIRRIVQAGRSTYFCPGCQR